MKNKILILIAIIAFSACKKTKDQSNQQASNIQLDFVKTFEGQIDNKYDIILKITSNEGQIDGNYCYKSVGTNIQVKGSLDTNGNLTLNEFDTKGNQTGLFSGKMVNNNKIEGNWSKPNGDKEKPFLLIESNSNYELSKIKNHQVKLKFDDNALDVIKKYYNKQVDEEYIGRSRYEDKVEDSIYNRTYYHIPDDEDDSSGYNKTIYIPINESRNLIYGDLNNDNLQDLVVAVSTESGASYCQPAELFVFLNQNNKLTLTDVAEIHNLSDCEHGHFWPTKIENGYLIGSSYCFKNVDAYCCPSLKYSTRTKLSNNKLVYNSQIKLK